MPSVSAMMAKRQVEEMYRDPPLPHFEGCTKVTLFPLLRTMRLVGLYFDVDHFPRATSYLLSNLCKNDPSCSPTKQWLKSRVSSQTGEDLDISSTISFTEDQSLNMKPAAQDLNFVSQLIKKEDGVMEEQEILDAMTGSQEFPTPGGQIVEGNVDTNLSTSKDENIGRFHKSSWVNIAYRCNAIFVLLLLWGNFLRCIIYIGDDRVTLVAVNTIAFFLTGALNITILHISCWKSSHFCAFFLNWALMYKDTTTRRLGLRGGASNSYLKYVMALNWILVVMNVAFGVYIMTQDESFSNSHNIILYVTGHKSPATIVISTVILFYCACAWTTPILFIVAICKYLVAHFDHFKDTLKLHIAAAGDTFPPRFTELRERHLAMCTLTSVMDRYMKLALTIIYCFSIVGACFLLYQVLGWRLHRSVLVFCIIWVVSSLAQVMIITNYASEVNTAVQLFLAMVNGPDLGFSVLDMIIIKRELMLTLFGLIITYSLIVFQFRQS